MYLTIDTIVSATFVRDAHGFNDRNIDGVTVVCSHPYRFEGRTFEVDITAVTVTVRETVTSADSDINMARVLVAPDLIDATRRLYNLVG